MSREVISEDGRVWTLGRRLGAGGQGEVFAVSNSRFAVKLLQPGDGAREALRDRLQSIKTLPLEQLPIARPIVQLRPPEIGYVMRLVDDMEPFDGLCAPPRYEAPASWYLETGGMLRRLRLLTRLAELLETLHARGIVYGDLSATNALVSADVGHHELWLIDPDNLRFSTSPPGRLTRTLPYAPPELQSPATSLVNTLTEAHALAVLVYQALTLAHPLLDGEQVFEDPDLRLPALRGELPWIDHATERANARNCGLPPELVLSEPLRELARRTFEEGLRQPQRRPGVGEWAQQLAWAAGVCVECPACGGTYRAGRPPCPWCGAPRPRLVMVSFGVPDEAGNVTPTQASPRALGVERAPLAITRRLAFGDRRFDSESLLVGTVELDGDRLVYQPEVDGTAIGRGSEYKPLAAGKRLPISAERDGLLQWQIRFTDSDGSERRTARLQVVSAA